MKDNKRGSWCSWKWLALVAFLLMPTFVSRAFAFTSCTEFLNDPDYCDLFEQFAFSLDNATISQQGNDLQVSGSFPLDVNFVNGSAGFTHFSVVNTAALNNGNASSRDQGDVAVCVSGGVPVDQLTLVTCQQPANGLAGDGNTPNGTFYFLLSNGEPVDTNNDSDNDSSVERFLRFVLVSNNDNPSISITNGGVTQTVIRNSVANQEVFFDVSASDPDGGDVVTLGSSGDGTFSAGPNAGNPATGTYRIEVSADPTPGVSTPSFVGTITAADNNSGSDQQDLRVTVQDPPPTINAVATLGSLTLNIDPDNPQTVEVLVSAANNGNPGEIITIAQVSGPQEVSLLGGNNPGSPGGGASQNVRFSIPENTAGAYTAVFRATNSINGLSADVTVTVGVGTSGGTSRSRQRDRCNDPGITDPACNPTGEEDPCSDDNVDRKFQEWDALPEGDPRKTELEGELSECGYTAPGSETPEDEPGAEELLPDQFCEEDKCASARQDLRQHMDENASFYTFVMCKAVGSGGGCSAFANWFQSALDSLMGRLETCQTRRYPSACVPPAGRMNALWSRVISSAKILNKPEGTDRLADEEVVRLRTFREYLGTMDVIFNEVQREKRKEDFSKCVNCTEEPCFPCFIDMRLIFELEMHQWDLLRELAGALASDPPDQARAEQLREQLRDVAEKMDFEMRMVHLMRSQCNDFATAFGADICYPFPVPPEIYPVSYVDPPCPCLAIAHEIKRRYDNEYVPMVDEMRQIFKRPAQMTTPEFAQAKEQLNAKMAEIMELFDDYLDCAEGRDDCPAFPVATPPYNECDEICLPYYTNVAQPQIDAICDRYTHLGKLEKDAKRAEEEEKKRLEKEKERLKNAKQQKQNLKNQLKQQSRQARAGGGLPNGQSPANYEQNSLKSDQRRLNEVNQQLEQLHENPNMLSDPALSSQFQELQQEQESLQNNLNAFNEFHQQFQQNMQQYQQTQQEIDELEQQIRQSEQNIRQAQKTQRRQQKLQEQNETFERRQQEDEEELHRLTREKSQESLLQNDERVKELEKEIKKLQDRMNRRQKQNKKNNEKESKERQKEMQELEQQYQELMDELQICSDRGCPDDGFNNVLATQCGWDSNVPGVGTDPFNAPTNDPDPQGDPQTGDGPDGDPADPAGPDPGATPGGGAPAGPGGGAPPSPSGDPGSGTQDPNAPPKPNIPQAGGQPGPDPNPNPQPGPDPSGGTGVDPALLGAGQQGPGQEDPKDPSDPGGSGTSQDPSDPPPVIISGGQPVDPAETDPEDPPSSTDPAPPSTPDVDRCEYLRTALQHLDGEIQGLRFVQSGGQTEITITTETGTKSVPLDEHIADKWAQREEYLTAISECEERQVTQQTHQSAVSTSCDSLGQMRSELSGVETSLDGTRQMIEEGSTVVRDPVSGNLVNLQERVAQLQLRIDDLRNRISSCEQQVATKTQEDRDKRTIAENELTTWDRYPHLSSAEKDQNGSIIDPLEARIGDLICGKAFLEKYIESYTRLSRNLVADKKMTSEQREANLQSLRDRLERAKDKPVPSICRENQDVLCGVGVRGQIERLTRIRETASALDKAQIDKALDYLQTYLRDFCPQRNLSCGDLTQYGDTLLRRMEEVKGEERAMVRLELDWVEKRLKKIGCSKTVITDERPMADFPHFLPPKHQSPEEDEVKEEEVATTEVEPPPPPVFDPQKDPCDDQNLDALYNEFTALEDKSGARGQEIREHFRGCKLVLPDDEGEEELSTTGDPGTPATITETKKVYSGTYEHKTGEILECSELDDHRELLADRRRLLRESQGANAEWWKDNVHKLRDFETHRREWREDIDKLEKTIAHCEGQPFETVEVTRPATPSVQNDSGPQTYTPPTAASQERPKPPPLTEEEKQFRSQLKGLPSDAQLRALCDGITQDYIDSYERWGKRMVLDELMEQSVLDAHLSAMRSMMNGETTESFPNLCSNDDFMRCMGPRSRLGMVEDLQKLDGLSDDQKANLQATQEHVQGYVSKHCPSSKAFNCEDLIEYTQYLAQKRRLLPGKEARSLLDYEIQAAQERFEGQDCMTTLASKFRKECLSGPSLAAIIQRNYAKLRDKMGVEKADAALRKLFGDQMNNEQFTELKALLNPA